jgi:hypothetical protein
VTGTYLGSRFFGTVTSRRAHTINHLVWTYTVELAEPCHITLIDRTEDEWLMISTSWDGTVCPPKAGDWGETGDHVAELLDDGGTP